MSNNNLSALLIGPTDKIKIFKFGKINKKDYVKYKEKIGKILATNLSTIYLIPDEGIPLDMARSYKQFGGKEVIGVIPIGECGALARYFKFCDKIEEVDGGWTVLNTCLCLKAGLMIGFGLSSGTLVEIAYSKYHKKYLGKEIPILLDERTISRRLNLEVEDEIDLKYFDSDERLKQFFKKLRGI